MKRSFFFIPAIAVLCLMSCGGNPTPTPLPVPSPNIDATVAARVEELATRTAVAFAQNELVVQQTAAAQAQFEIAATQTALAATAAAPKPTALPQPSPLPVNTQVPLVQATNAPTKTNVAPVAVVNTKTPRPSNCNLPLYVYSDWGAKQNHFFPEGFMGDSADVVLDYNFKLDATRPVVIKIVYTPTRSNRWAGIYWWDPHGSSFGAIDGGFNLSCATKLTFVARGENGGEVAEFKVGGLDEKFQDSLRPAKSSGPLVLTNQWTRYTIDLTNENTSHVIGGFVWVANADQNPTGATIYVDEIRFE